MKVSPKTAEEVALAGLITPGIYDFEVLDAKDTFSKAGNDMVELQIGIFDGSGRSRKVFDYLVDLDSMAFKNRHFAESVGMLADYERGEMKANDMFQRTGRCKVYVKKDKTGQYPDKNAIGDYLPPDPRMTKATVVASREPAPFDDEVPF